MRDKDIRIKLLKKLNELNNGTSEFIANEYLSKLHTDLGTIRRLLIELIDFDMIRESNIPKENYKESIIRNINTTKSKGENFADLEFKKSSKRLKGKYGEFDKIPDVRITITIKGLKFLTENEKLFWDSKMAKWKHYTFWPLLIFSFLMGAYQVKISTQNKESDQIAPIEHNIETINIPDNDTLQ
jgi:hypothetical protein